MILKGRLAELMVAGCAKPVQEVHIRGQEKGGHTLRDMQKAIYRLLRSALLFYKKLVANLESIGF